MVVPSLPFKGSSVSDCLHGMPLSSPSRKSLKFSVAVGRTCRWTEQLQRCCLVEKKQKSLTHTMQHVYVCSVYRIFWSTEATVSVLSCSSNIDFLFCKRWSEMKNLTKLFLGFTVDWNPKLVLTFYGWNALLSCCSCDGNICLTSNSLHAVISGNVTHTSSTYKMDSGDKGTSSTAVSARALKCLGVNFYTWYLYTTICRPLSRNLQNLVLQNFFSLWSPFRGTWSQSAVGFRNISHFGAVRLPPQTGDINLTVCSPWPSHKIWFYFIHLLEMSVF